MAKKSKAKTSKKPAANSTRRVVKSKPANKGRVLITGAAGFLGSHLCDRFIKEGYHVIGMDNLITGRLKNIEHLFKSGDFEFYNHDVSKFVHVPGALKYILHFASPASPIDYEKIPIQTLKVGSLGTHNLLGLARVKKARILVASTSEVYGDPKVHPQNETYWGHVNPVGKRSMYDEAKRFQEAMTMAYHNYHGLETRMVRIFNTYGPRMRLNDGRVVPAFMGQALRGEDLTIFGKGDQTRSFCYVDDLVEGIYRLLLSDYAGPVNVGNPKEITIKQFAQEILKLTDTKQKLIYKPLPSDDPMQRQPDITLAKKLLKWQPKVDRAEGMRRTFEYFKGLSKAELNEKEHFSFEKYARK
ncbi:MAG: SDR family oxidoreductase [Flavobacteriales bacterium]|nr:SDR family oxidoreductase [Flavobacteriales bacterium]